MRKRLVFDEKQTAKLGEYLYQGATHDLLARVFEVSRKIIGCEAANFVIERKKVGMFVMLLRLYKYLLAKSELDTYDKTLKDILGFDIVGLIRFKYYIYLFEIAEMEPPRSPHTLFLRAVFGTYISPFDFDEELDAFIASLAGDCTVEDFGSQFRKVLYTKLKSGYYTMPRLTESDHSKILDVIDTLTDREAEIIKRRFGFFDGKQKTLEDVARVFGTARDRIRQIEAKALRKLQHASRSKNLKHLLSVTTKMEWLENQVYQLELKLAKIQNGGTSSVENSSMQNPTIEDMPIENLELSVRSFNCLKTAKIDTLYELLEKSERELLSTSHSVGTGVPRVFGQKSLDEIKELLTKMGGLHLRQE